MEHDVNLNVTGWDAFKLSAGLAGGFAVVSLLLLAVAAGVALAVEGVDA
jgi:hypothetical protein